MSKNRIDITEQEAIDLKENITEEEKDFLKNAVKKEIRKKHRKKTKYMKAAAVAACVLIVAPTTIYGKEIQRFFQSKWKQNIFRMEVQVTKEKKSKQNVSLDTNNLKQYGVTKEKSKKETWYAFKNQKINNKDFYARLIKVDQTIKKNFFVNDVEKYSEAEIAGNKVLILSMNHIDGKKDNKVYIFYEKEGYILEIPSCELSKDQILNTVKNIMVQECNKKDADKAISLTKYLKEQNILLQAWSPLAAGDGRLFENELLKEIAQNHNKSVAQIVLRWLIQREIVPVVKSANPVRMKENLDIFDFELSKEDMQIMMSMDLRESTGRGYPEQYEY